MITYLIIDSKKFNRNVDFLSISTDKHSFKYYDDERTSGEFSGDVQINGRNFSGEHGTADYLPEYGFIIVNMRHDPLMEEKEEDCVSWPIDQLRAEVIAQQDGYFTHKELLGGTIYYDEQSDLVKVESNEGIFRKVVLDY